MRSSGSWKERVQAVKKETLTLYFACRHPLVPWYAKASALIVVGYALSPIDLIPDFIPVLGYVDDLIIVPLGISLVLSLIPEPEEVMAEYRAMASEAETRSIVKNAPSLHPQIFCSLLDAVVDDVEGDFGAFF